STLFNYYKSLIQLRKQLPALQQLNREQLSVSCNPGQNTIILQRWQEENAVLILMNFSNKEQSVRVDNIKKSWKKVFDSSDPKWKGLKAAPDSIEKNTVTLQPESILIYSL
ncbi:MAG: DUF3459 domain-containing protein, partial [Pedobacter sp.]